MIRSVYTDRMRECRKIVPSIHKKYIESMVGMFGDSAEHCIRSMQPAADKNTTIDMENYYSRLALDIIGKARFLAFLFASLANNYVSLNDSCRIHRMHASCAALPSHVRPSTYWKVLLSRLYCNTHTLFGTSCTSTNVPLLTTAHSHCCQAFHTSFHLMSCTRSS